MNILHIVCIVIPILLFIVFFFININKIKIHDNNRLSGYMPQYLQFMLIWLSISLNSWFITKNNVIILLTSSIGCLLGFIVFKLVMKSTTRELNKQLLILPVMLIPVYFSMITSESGYRIVLDALLMPYLIIYFYFLLTTSVKVGND